MDQIPLIDLSKLPDDPVSMAQLDAACRQWGFFQVTGHGIDHGLLNRLQQQMRLFFALPEDCKKAVERSDTNAWGYYDRELTKTILDRKQVFDVGPAETSGPLAGASPQWPEQLPTFRPALEAYDRAATAAAQQLLSAIGVNLGLPRDHLIAEFVPHHTSFVRLNYYPIDADNGRNGGHEQPEIGELGINPHSDAGALTLLLQDQQPGLQVLRDGAWHTVPPEANALVVNIGDIVQVWSNDTYQAPLHRVLRSTDVPRYSAPFFFNPGYATNYAPLTTQVSADNPAHYRPIIWGEFRAGRAAGDYANLGEEIQISQFRI